MLSTSYCLVSSFFFNFIFSTSSFLRFARTGSSALGIIFSFFFCVRSSVRWLFVRKNLRLETREKKFFSFVCFLFSLHSSVFFYHQHIIASATIHHIIFNVKKRKEEAKNKIKIPSIVNVRTAYTCVRARTLNMNASNEAHNDRQLYRHQRHRRRFPYLLFSALSGDSFGPFHSINVLSFAHTTS